MSEEKLFQFVTWISNRTGIGEIPVILILAVLATFSFLIFWFKFVPWAILKMAGSETETLMTGMPGTATVLEIGHASGDTENGQLMMLLLEVKPQKGPAYQARIRVDAKIENVELIKPDAVLPVKISNDDPQKVVLFLEEEEDE